MHPYTLLYNDRPVVGDPISDWFCVVEHEVLGLILVTHHGLGCSVIATENGLMHSALI